MNKKCRRCGLVNFADSIICNRCQTDLIEIETIPSKRGFLKSSFIRRIAVFIFAASFAVFGFYMTLVVSAKSLSLTEKQAVARSFAVLEQKGFENEVFLLRNFTVFRRSDNWLNSSVEKENAYAATNFPFEIMTLYEDFFQYPIDDIERAAILLHEAKHLEGKGEREAYEFVWRNRHKLGWTIEKYGSSMIWQDVRRQTSQNAPDLFVCQFNDHADCTETKHPLL